MSAITTKHALAAAALLLAGSVTAHALPVPGGTVVLVGVRVGLGTMNAADPLLSGPDSPFRVFPLEGFRPPARQTSLAPEPTHSLHEVIEQIAPADGGAPAPAPAGTSAPGRPLT